MRRMPFDKVYRRFKWAAIPVRDVTGAYVNGVWVEEVTAVEREIAGIPFLEGAQTLEIYSDGEATSGRMTLTTDAPLYWTDINATGQTQMQSYVTYQGYIWRVVGTNQMRGNVDALTIYTLLRYIR